MNIVHVISSPAAGGAEVYVKDLAKKMVIDGNRVFVVFLSRAGDVGRDKKYEMAFLNDLEQAGVNYFMIGRHSRKNIVYGMLRIRRFVRLNNIHIYHSHLKYGVLFGARNVTKS